MKTKEEIGKILDSKKANKPCARCGHSKFIILDYSLVASSKKPQRTVIDRTIPIVLVGCNNCGNIVQHALGPLGLLKKKD